MLPIERLVQNTSCPICGQLFRIDEQSEHMKSCTTPLVPHVQCQLCHEYVLLKDWNSHFSSKCKILQERVLCDFYECPLCGENLPESEKTIHEYFKCKVLLEIHDGPLYSLSEEKFTKRPKEETQKEMPKVGQCLYCKTTLNENILLFHQNECVHQPIKCSDCSESILQKDFDNHKCKLPKGKDKDSSTISHDTQIDGETVLCEEETCKNNALELKGVHRLVENLKSLLLNEQSSDVLLKIEDREFKAHRIILKTRSPVFAAMFQPNTKESTTGIVDIPDCSALAFEVFLLYIYTGKADSISSDNVLDLYYAADKYEINDLKWKCVEFMEENLSVDNFCEVMTLCLQHSETGLKKKATQFFCDNVKTIIKTVQWQKYLKQYSTYANELIIKAFNA